MDRLTILAVDIGNSRVKAGLFDHDELIARSSEQSIRLTYAGEWEEFWDRLFVGAQHAVPLPNEVDQIAYSCVIPAVEATFLAWVGRQFQSIPMTKVSAANYPYKIDYSTPETLGPDRLADALGGFKRCGGALIVVDFGTAVTLNVVDSSGTFLGGAIAPGATLMAKALSRGTAQLPSISVDYPPSPLGKSTMESIASAATYGLVDLVDGLIERYSAILPIPARVIATGGNGEKFSDKSRKIDEFIPNLTLEGIAEFARIGTERR